MVDGGWRLLTSLVLGQCECFKYAIVKILTPVIKMETKASGKEKIYFIEGQSIHS